MKLSSHKRFKKPLSGPDLSTHGKDTNDFVNLLDDGTDESVGY